MAKMEVLLDRADARYYPGETVSGKAVLTLEKPVRYRKIAALLSGVEATEIGAGKNRSTEKNVLLENAAVLKEEAGRQGMLNPGVYEFPFGFTLPASIPPTYTGNNASIFYGIRAYLDMPLRLDIKSIKDIIVSQRGATEAGIPFSFSSETLNTQKPSFTVSARKSIFRPGEAITGSITLFNPAGSRVRQAVIKACAREHAKAQWSRADSEVFKAEATLKDLTNGVPREFSIQIPEDAPQGFASKLSGLEWQLEAWLDIPLGLDVKAKKAISVL